MSQINRCCRNIDWQCEGHDAADRVPQVFTTPASWLFKQQESQRRQTLDMSFIKQTTPVLPILLTMSHCIDFAAPRLFSLHAHAQSCAEGPTWQLWQHVLADLVLPSRRWRVNLNVPVVAGSFHMVDMVVRRWDENESATVLLWLSGADGVASPQSVAALEARACALADEFLARTVPHKRTAVWLMTAVGVHAKIWLGTTTTMTTTAAEAAAEAAADEDLLDRNTQLVPVFPSARYAGTPDAYRDLRGHEVEFAFWLAFMQKHHLPTTELVADIAGGRLAGVLIDAVDAVHVSVLQRRGTCLECELPNGSIKTLPLHWLQCSVVWQDEARPCDTCRCEEDDGG